MVAEEQGHVGWNVAPHRLNGTRQTQGTEKRTPFHSRSCSNTGLHGHFCVNAELHRKLHFPLAKIQV